MYKGKMRVIVHNKEVELYTIGHTAKLIKKSVETIRAWERQKIIPPPLFKSKKVRLYHPKEIEAMKKVLRRQKKNTKKEQLQKALWPAIQQARKELLEGELKKT